MGMKAGVLAPPQRAVPAGAADVQYIVASKDGGPQAFGSMAKRLLSVNFQVKKLRVHDLLRKDEWKVIDQTVQAIATVRTPAVTELIRRGLIADLTSVGLGATVFERWSASDITPATITMNIRQDPSLDRINYEPSYLPLPIIMKGFDLDARQLGMQRRLGLPLPTEHIAAATRVVSEKIEYLLFNGDTSLTYGGGTLYGLINHPLTLTGSLKAQWDDSGAKPKTDILAIISRLAAQNHKGPYGVFVAGNYRAAIEDDYLSNYPSPTIRQRLLGIDGVQFVLVCDELPDDYVVVAELMPDTLRMVVAVQPYTVEWETRGGLQTDYIVLAVVVPDVRADQAGHMGVAAYK